MSSPYLLREMTRRFSFIIVNHLSFVNVINDGWWSLPLIHFPFLFFLSVPSVHLSLSLSHTSGNMYTQFPRFSLCSVSTFSYQTHTHIACSFLIPCLFTCKDNFVQNGDFGYGRVGSRPLFLVFCLRLIELGKAQLPVTEHKMRRKCVDPSLRNYQHMLTSPGNSFMFGETNSEQQNKIWQPSGAISTCNTKRNQMTSHLH